MRVRASFQLDASLRTISARAGVTVAKTDVRAITNPKTMRKLVEGSIFCDKPRPNVRTRPYRAVAHGRSPRRHRLHRPVQLLLRAPRGRAVHPPHRGHGPRAIDAGERAG